MCHSSGREPDVIQYQIYPHWCATNFYWEDDYERQNGSSLANQVLFVYLKELQTIKPQCEANCLNHPDCLHGGLVQPRVTEFSLR